MGLGKTLEACLHVPLAAIKATADRKVLHPGLILPPSIGHEDWTDIAARMGLSVILHCRENDKSPGMKHKAEQHQYISNAKPIWNKVRTHHQHPQCRIPIRPASLRTCKAISCQQNTNDLARKSPTSGELVDFHIRPGRYSSPGVGTPRPSHANRNRYSGTLNYLQSDRDQYEAQHDCHSHRLLDVRRWNGGNSLAFKRICNLACKASFGDYLRQNNLWCVEPSKHDRDGRKSNSEERDRELEPKSKKFCSGKFRYRSLRKAKARAIEKIREHEIYEDKEEFGQAYQGNNFTTRLKCFACQGTVPLSQVPVVIRRGTRSGKSLLVGKRESSALN